METLDNINSEIAGEQQVLSALKSKLQHSVLTGSSEKSVIEGAIAETKDNIARLDHQVSLVEQAVEMAGKMGVAPDDVDIGFLDTELSRGETAEEMRRHIAKGMIAAAGPAAKAVEEAFSD